MTYTKLQLKTLWDKESELYKTQEVGSGIHRFVKSVLECPDIFNLEEGKLTTPNEKRKNEFIHEHKTKGRRQVDFVIFINSDIVIPIEAEQYTNISQGEEQLTQYQTDLEKKYGILTDGYTWRFYNNSIYQILTLDQLLSETTYFLDFWKEYIKPEYYYLSFFEEIGQLTFFGKEELHIEKNRQLFFEDITTLIKSFRNKLRIEGYFDGLEKAEALKKATEITYAYIIQFILYKTLVDNRFDDFGNDYKSRIETIRNAIKTQSYKDILGVINGMSYQISENIYRPFIKEQEHINSKLLKLYYEAKNKLSDVSPWLDIVVFIKKYNFLNVHNEIFGYVYENYLKELDREGKKGQYFTDPSVVNFMLDQVGYTAKSIRNKIKSNELNKLSIVDPACGSGTFLYSATDEIVKSFNAISSQTSKKIEEIVTSNIFGLDVEDFPLYLAEMNILMRMLSLIMGEKYNNPLEKKIKVFWTQDSTAEFIGSGLETTNDDTSRREGQLSYFGKIVQPVYHSYMRDENDLEEMKGSMASFPRRRFDYVVANPPYIRYNDCVRQGMLIFKMMKRGTVKLSNVYGVNLHSTPNNHKKYAPKPNLYAFFIALGLALLKENGKLCYIIPQTIMVNPDFDVLRYHLAKYTTIEKITIFNSKMFIGRGLNQTRSIPTSSLIIIVEKKTPEIDHEVEIINYRGKDKNEGIKETVQNISKGKYVKRGVIRQNKLLENLENWNFIRQDISYLDFIQQYKSNTSGFSIYYEHTIAESTFKNRFYFDGGAVIGNKNITKKATSNTYEILETLSDFGYLIPQGHTYYPKDAKFNFPQGSQGIKAFFQKYKIIWRTKNTKDFHYTDRDVLLVTNKYLMISSNDRSETLYLLSLLNSKVTKFIFENVVKVKGEDTSTILVSLRIIKEQIRVPKITVQNKDIKEEIIRRTEQLLDLEEKTLSNFVDFSDILVQKVNDVYVINDTLILAHDNRETKLQIKECASIIADVLVKAYRKEELELKERSIYLEEIRNLPIPDHKLQRQLVAYINDLIFALYFNIPVTTSLAESNKIHDKCEQNELYKLLDVTNGLSSI